MTRLERPQKRVDTNVDIWLDMQKTTTELRQHALGGPKFCDPCHVPLMPVYNRLVIAPGYTPFFMLNSTEHEISTANKN